MRRSRARCSSPALRSGVHSLNGFLARSDQSKITGSDASAITFTTTSNTPKLNITSPVNGATITGTTISVSYSTTGDLTEADHVYIRLDGGPDMRVQSLSGAMQIDSVAAGAHTLTGYVARSDNSKIAGSDAATISFYERAARHDEARRRHHGAARRRHRERNADHQCECRGRRGRRGSAVQTRWRGARR